MRSGVRVTFLISTHNRRDVLLATLRRLAEAGYAASCHETIVVDNHSSDRTAEAVAREFPEVRLIAIDHNRGPVSKNLGLAAAGGEFVIFLDDDSFPHAGAIERMIEHFRTDDRLGVVNFNVTLPDGSRECSAYPDVFIGCGAGFRKAALDEVGGLPDDFFMAAEEYDLSLRLLDAGWRIVAPGDLDVTHLKNGTSRFPERITRLDVRNNIILAARHFPLRWGLVLGLDWTRRYSWIAASKGHRRAFWLGLAQGIGKCFWRLRRRPIGTAAFEQFSRMHQIERQMRRIALRYGARRVLLVDVGKSIYAFHRAAALAGLRVVAIADGALARPGRNYRGIRVVSDDDAMNMEFDLIVISNLSPVHAARRLGEWRQRMGDRIPVVDLLATPCDRALISQI